MASNRKFNRNRKSPQNAAYKIEKRAEIHKIKRIKKQAAFVLDCKTNPPKIPRGTARSIRRGAKDNGNSSDYGTAAAASS